MPISLIALQDPNRARYFYLQAKSGRKCRGADLGESADLLADGVSGLAIGAGLAALGQAETVSAQPDGLDGDEAAGGSRVEATLLVHGGELLVVQELLGAAALDDDVALVELELDLTVDSLLRLRDAGSDKLALGREEEAVIELLGELGGDDLVADSAHLTVERETLEVEMGGTQDGGTGRLVAAARLDADEAVLDNVDAADAVLASELVEGEEDVDGVGVLLAGGGDLDLGGDALLELDDDVLGGVWGGLGALRELPHVGGRGGVGVLEDSGLVGNVEEVLVGGPGLGLGLGDGDALGLCVLEQRGSAGEAVEELGNAPRGDDLDVGLEAVEGELEADWSLPLPVQPWETYWQPVLSAASIMPRAMTGRGERGAEQVDVLVDGVGLDSGEDELLNELALEVGEDEVLGAALERLGASGLEVLLLADVGHEGDDVVALIDEPCEDGGRVCVAVQREVTMATASAATETTTTTTAQ
ncbi:hypothetical protein L1887_51562 [Cichorium endivia]|nr:hypothetical protein L1887_51562 [Cichorium endivia]